jgi:hypothetical protein
VPAEEEVVGDMPPGSLEVHSSGRVAGLETDLISSHGVLQHCRLRMCVQVDEFEAGTVAGELYGAPRREQAGLASADRASSGGCYCYALKELHMVRTGEHWLPRAPASSGNGAHVA